MENGKVCNCMPVQQMMGGSCLISVFFSSPQWKSPPARALDVRPLETILVEFNEAFPLRYIASQHALVYVGPDLGFGVRSVHVVTAKLRILLVHQNLSVDDFAIGVHVGCSRGI